MRYMFGKGAKRKLAEDEEGLEDKTLEAAAGGGLGSAPEGLSKVSYTLQRQTIFNISLMKLYSQRPLGEPRLERRVLINNMLRRIQDELRREGSLRPLLLPPSPPPDDPMDEGFREAPPPFGVLPAAAMAPPPSPHPLVPPGFPPRVETCLTPASLLEEDGGESAFCSPSPPTPPLSPPPMELGAAAITRTVAADTTTMTTSPPPTPVPQSPQLASLSPPPPGSARDARTAKPEAAAVFLAELRQTDAPPAPPPPGLADGPPPSPSSPSGFLSDLALDDVLFADIDTSMYDFDPCTTAGAVGAAAGAKLPPVVTADDLLKSLASPYSGPAPQVSPNQPFKIDLTELDHIMEVLVGS